MEAKGVYPPMNADERRFIVATREDLDRLTAQIIAGAFEVSNVLGCGFLEKVYENSLAVELRTRGMAVIQQPRGEVRYKGFNVGAYVADMIVESRVVIEIKAVRALERVHDAQVMNYLRTTGLSVGLLFNFGSPRLDFKRVVWRF
jgi:GxxExxY protein